MNTVASLPAKLRWMIADASNLGVNERTIDLAVLEEAAAALATPNPVRAEQPEGKGEDALIALFNEVYEREWDRAADEADDRAKAIMGPADEHATRMAIRAVLASAHAAEVAERDARIAELEADKKAMFIRAREWATRSGEQEQRAEAAERDARRYRWLKENDSAFLLAEDVLDDQIAIATTEQAGA